MRAIKTLTLFAAHAHCLHDLDQEPFAIEPWNAHGLAGGGVRGRGLQGGTALEVVLVGSERGCLQSRGKVKGPKTRVNHVRRPTPEDASVQTKHLIKTLQQQLGLHASSYAGHLNKCTSEPHQARIGLKEVAQPTTLTQMPTSPYEPKRRVGVTGLVEQ
ncbi:hypothetical protein E2C01_033649 [Portunus trituberculatus]|uniref:Uncharacterized protein n=1 Tax=Portunus trituberculatus TaxID=210409 RepID=A0A5B7F3H3_PORTR|nr:hypothetical protein [Portunus trituberculatus]